MSISHTDIQQIWKFQQVKKKQSLVVWPENLMYMLLMYQLVLNEALNMCVIPDEPGGEARGADPGPGVSSEAEGQLAAETQHAAAQQRHAVPAAARRPRRSQ